MPARKLKLLLGKGHVASDLLREIITHCDDWYFAEPSPVTFGLLALFRDLERRDWTDSQGVPADKYEPFQRQVLPHLLQITDTLSATPAAEPIDELDALVVAYRDSIKATP